MSDQDQAPAEAPQGTPAEHVSGPRKREVPDGMPTAEEKAKAAFDAAEAKRQASQPSWLQEDGKRRSPKLPPEEAPQAPESAPEPSAKEEAPAAPELSPDMEKARAALLKDKGWTKADVEAMEPDTLLRVGLRRAREQEKQDQKFKELRDRRSEEGRQRKARAETSATPDVDSSADTLSGLVSPELAEQLGLDDPKPLEKLLQPVQALQGEVERLRQAEGQRIAEAELGRLGERFPEVAEDADLRNSIAEDAVRFFDGGEAGLDLGEAFDLAAYRHGMRDPAPSLQKAPEPSDPKREKAKRAAESGSLSTGSRRSEPKPVTARDKAYSVWGPIARKHGWA